MKHCKKCNRARKGKSPTISSPIAVTKKASSIHKTVNEESKTKRKELRQTTEYTNNSITACGEIVDEKKRQNSIDTSHTTKTENGIRSLRTYVPPDLVAQISTQLHKNRDDRAYCKVTTCHKLDQSKLDGFCRRHFNMFALNEAEDVRVYDCGEMMDGEQEQCANCTQVRFVSALITFDHNYSIHVLMDVFLYPQPYFKTEGRER